MVFTINCGISMSKWKHFHVKMEAFPCQNGSRSIYPWIDLLFFIKKHVGLSCGNLVCWYLLHLVIITFEPDIVGLVETEGYIVASVNSAAEVRNDTDERKLFCWLIV